MKFALVNLLVCQNILKLKLSREIRNFIETRSKSGYINYISAIFHKFKTPGTHLGN